MIHLIGFKIFMYVYVYIYIYIYIYLFIYLLPTGSAKREVLEVGSIPDAILPSCQYICKYCIIIAQI